MTFAFFRKYNKIILAVGGSILMVIFLIPQVSYMFTSKPGDQVVGMIGDREIFVHDRQTAAAEIELLRRLSPEQIGPTLPQGSEGTLVWLLMLEEAKRQGLWASRPEAIAILQGMEIDPQLLATIMRDTGAGEDFLYQTIRHWRMFRMTQELVAGSQRPSEPEIRRFARDVQSQVAVKMVGISAETLLDQIETPTQAELEDRFRLNSNDLPGNSAAYGFGYRLEPRVKLEYLAFPLDRVKAAVSVDEVEAQRYYMEHPSEFMPPEPEGATPPVEGETKPLVETQPLAYRDVRQRIIDMLTEGQAAQLQQQVLREATGLLNESVRRFERDAETGYLKIPAGAEIIPLEQVAEQVQRSTGILPDVVRLDEKLIPLTEVAELPGFGDSILVVGSGEQARGLPVAVYLSLAHEFHPPADHPLAGLQLRVQVNVPTAVLVNEGGTAYIARLTEAEPSRSPLSLDEVRDAVEHDVKLLKAYGLLGQRAEEYATKAREGGLEAIVASVGGNIEAQDVDLFSRRDMDVQNLIMIVPNLPVVGRSEQFVDGVFKIADAAETAGTLEQVPEDQRIGVVGVDRQLTLYVVEITKYEPITAEMYDQLRMTLMRMIAQLGLLNTMRSGYLPFSVETLADRVGFAPLHPESAEEDEEESVPAAPVQ